MELQELLKVLEEGAWELVNLGNSHEKAQGQGMMTVIIAVKKLIKENDNQ